MDVTVVRWYERLDRSPGIVPRWLAAARAHLPAATPRRFGDVEPLRREFAEEGTAGLLRAYDSARTLLFMVGTPPVHDISLACAERSRQWGSVGAHTLHTRIPPGDARLRRFALALTHPATVYVSASVERGVELDGGTLYGPGHDPAEPFLAPLGRWLGLPPEPPPWCWFGRRYARSVRGDVRATPEAGGLLYTGGPWVPPHWRARPEEFDPGRRRADRIPFRL